MAYEDKYIKDQNYAFNDLHMVKINELWKGQGMLQYSSLHVSPQYINTHNIHKRWGTVCINTEPLYMRSYERLIYTLFY